MKEHEHHFELERDLVIPKPDLDIVDLWKRGELKLDFESELLFRRTALSELTLMLSKYLKRIKPTDPAHEEFKFHFENVLHLKANEEILDRELRTARQRASDLEFKVLLMTRERETFVQAEEEIKINNDELRELYLENERLKNENAELIKML